ncbi:MAG: EAL domain-containing protein [Zetaproteobacteria bacterium]|nr:MAG: EAL domain-containing protein [Zetaproteobacteria bacterium]
MADSTQPARSPAQPRLAVVEDNPHVARVVCKLARRAGFDVTHHPTAMSLRQAPTTPPPLAIVLDLGLPDEDGIALLDFIQERLAASAIIIMSGKEPGVIHATAQLIEARGLRLLGTLHKPFRIQALQRLLVALRGERRKAPRTAEEEAQTVTPEMLRHALHSGAFVPFYQPQTTTREGTIVGFEALMRWRHPEWGIVAPGRFIPLAARHNLLTEMTWMMLEQVAEDWRRLGWRKTTVAVNLPASFLMQPRLPEKLIALCARQGLAPTQLVLEITESEALEDLSHQLGNLIRLRLSGFSLSIDDFGTGYSSLISLYQTPFQELKIDQAFVMRADSDPIALEIIRTLVFLSGRLRIALIAEGVEREDLRALLARVGVERIQGYLIHPPMPFDELAAWRREYQPVPSGEEEMPTTRLTAVADEVEQTMKQAVDPALAAPLSQAIRERADDDRFRSLFAHFFDRVPQLPRLLGVLLHCEYTQLQQEMADIQQLPEEEQFRAIRGRMEFFEHLRALAVEVREGAWRARLEQAEARAAREHLERLLAESSVVWLRRRRVRLIEWIEEVPVQAVVTLHDIVGRQLLVELNRDLARLLAACDYQAQIATRDGKELIQARMEEVRNGLVRFTLGSIQPNRRGRRRHVRVCHPQQPPAQLQPRGGEERSCRIVDLSISGMRLALPPGSAASAVRTPVHCRFTIDGGEIRGKGTVRWQSRGEDGEVQCGISFACANSTMQKLLHEEALRLQRDLIARLNNTQLPVLLRNALDEMER